MVRGTRAFVAAAAALALGTSGCSWIFVRTPTPEAARKPGACEGRGIASAVDGLLAAALFYNGASAMALEAPTRTGLALGQQRTSALKPEDVMWISVGSAFVFVGSAAWGVNKTMECSEWRAVGGPLPAGRPVQRQAPASVRVVPAAPAASPPGAAPAPAEAPPPPPPVPQQTDDE